MQYLWPDSPSYSRRSVSTLHADSLVTSIDLRYAVSVDQTTDGIFDGSITGFLGLAFQSLAVTQAVPFWQALVNNNLFASPEMSFWLTRYLNDTNAQTDEPGGVLTLGGANTTLYSGNIE